MRSPGLVSTSVVLVLSTLVAFITLLRLPVIYDADSYYHLAVARLYGEQGTVDTLPWARFSLLADGFSDKEWLFHVLLVPFVRLFEPTVGGRLFLAILNGLIYTALARPAMRLWRWQGALVPAWIFISAIPFASRAIRVRPEVLGLVLILAATTCVVRDRFRVLGVVTFFYTLSYTAFHALLGLCLLWCLERWWRARRLQVSMVLWPTLGAATAFLVHPHFPKNLYFWFVQNVTFYFGIEDLDVGDEIFPPGFDALVSQELGWWIGLAVLVLATVRSKSGEADGEAPESLAFEQRNRLAATGIAALCFGGLFVLMGRFGIYFVPLATLTLLAGLEVLGRRGTPFLGLPLGRARALPVLPVVVALGIAMIPGRGQLRTIWSEFFRDLEPLPVEADRRQWSQVVPDGARVAAHWGEAEYYVFYAPGAQYLNLLDPVFMALPYPETYDLQRGIFEDREPDVPLALVSKLESDWISFYRAPRTELFDRLLADPRIEPRYAGYHLLARVRDDSNHDFFLDWTVAAPSAATPPHASGEQAWTYPRLPRDPPLTALGLPTPASVEGYVDALRLPPEATAGACLVFHHPLSDDRPQTVRLELAASGPSTLMLDDEPVIEVGDSGRPALGAGGVVDLDLGTIDVEAPGRTLSVRTCRSQSGEYGFYLLRR